MLIAAFLGWQLSRPPLPPPGHRGLRGSSSAPALGGVGVAGGDVDGVVGGPGTVESGLQGGDALVVGGLGDLFDDDACRFEGGENVGVGDEGVQGDGPVSDVGSVDPPVDVGLVGAFASFQVDDAAERVFDSGAGGFLDQREQFVELVGCAWGALGFGNGSAQSEHSPSPHGLGSRCPRSASGLGLAG